MSMKLPQNPNAGLFKQGYNSYSNADGQITKSIAAIREIHQMCLTSMGPCGRNKIIVNHLGKIIVTNDAATMLRELEIVHPAVKVLVMATEQQKIDMGDGTNFVLVLAGELLNVAEKLIALGLSPIEIIQGYNMAKNFTLKELDSMCVNDITDKVEKSELIKLIKPVIASKQYGHEDILSDLVSTAVSYIGVNGKLGGFNVDSIRVVKIMGGALSNSQVIKGMVFNKEPESHLKSLSTDEKHKVVIFNCPIDIANTETKGTVLLHNAKEMLDFSKGEEQQLDEMIKAIADSGVKCVIAGSTVSDLALHYMNRYNLLVLKIGSKFELRRLSRVCGATPLARLGAPTPEEMGVIETVKTMEIGGDRVTVFKQESNEQTRCATIILRGATQNSLDDIERAIDDGVAAIKGLMKPDEDSGKLLAGAGATEIELVSRITKFGERTPGLLQLSIKQFAKAFEVIPRTLAETAGLNINEVLPNLYAAHANPSAEGQQEGQDTNKNNSNALYQGIDIDGIYPDGVKDVREDGIYDLLAAKKFAINVATDAANTVLSVDQIIMAKRAGGPAVPKGPKPGNWDQDD